MHQGLCRALGDTVMTRIDWVRLQGASRPAGCHPTLSVPTFFPRNGLPSLPHQPPPSFPLNHPSQLKGWRVVGHPPAAFGTKCVHISEPLVACSVESTGGA